MEDFLNTLTESIIQNEVLPIQALLKDSLYYPSAGLDGGVVKYFGKTVQSFVYCDYATGENRLLAELETFRGYHVVGHRSIKKEELTPGGLVMQKPRNINQQEYLAYKDFFKRPFAHWAVSERDNDKDESYGPERFSLLYIGGEGVATYQALYWSNKLVPNILAIIQPGTGFGLNWTNFKSKDGSLAWVVNNNPYGIPGTVLYGGYGQRYDDFDWHGFHYTNTIIPYYLMEGLVTVWRRDP